MCLGYYVRIRRVKISLIEKITFLFISPYILKFNIKLKYETLF